MVKRIGEANGEPIRLRNFLYPGVMNIKCGLIFGKRFAPQDPQFKLMQILIATWSTLLKSILLVDVLPPWVEELLAMYPVTTKGALRRVSRKLALIAGFDFFIDVFFPS